MLILIAKIIYEILFHINVLCVHVCACEHDSCVHACACMSMCICPYEYVCVCVYMCMHVSIFICICSLMHACTHNCMICC